ncbi:MAG: TerC family protein [Acidobacteriota bacterium]|nr:TerC family protein [Blastocatellia bacterium]MDW8412612.1 TerC family protein [Acidobacteriota bacterium]
MLQNKFLLLAGFSLLVVLMLLVDLGLFHKKTKSIDIREALLMSGFWIAIALAFNVGLYFWMGSEVALQFLAGYLLEKSLSVDNLFVFLLIFSYFRVATNYQYKVLFWGIIGALVMRAIFIGLGTALISRFHWVMYLFGAFLVYTGIKLGLSKDDDEEIQPENNPFVRVFKRFFPITGKFHEDHFFISKEGRLFATPLFIVLIIVETTDLVFALDSIPAVFGVSSDPFVVYTSNIFAILGLRALYFALAGIMNLFHYLKVGLSIVLTFIGAKMLLSGYYKVPILIALAVIAVVLGLSILASLVFPSPNEIATEQKTLVQTRLRSQDEDNRS